MSFITTNNNYLNKFSYFGRMSDKYKIFNQEEAYFITMTIVGWIDVFTRKNHKLLITNSLKYCQQNKGLIVEKEEDYLFSSARNYADLDNYLDIELITPKLETYN